MLVKSKTVHLSEGGLKTANEFERAIVAFLTEPEVEALLGAPDPTSGLGVSAGVILTHIVRIQPALTTGRRDQALLLVAVQTGRGSPS